MRGLIHFHSNHSYDSVNSIESIISFIEQESINFLILTDHEKISGSLELRESVSKRDINAIVPIAAEYKTDSGDLIAVFIKEEIRNMKAQSFIYEVHDQGGLVLLPHPYVGHKNLEKLITLVDLVETYNPRCSDEDNKKASELASKHMKPYYHGTDAHTMPEMKNALVELPTLNSEKELKSALLNSICISKDRKKSLSRLVFFSQMVRGFKKNSIRIIAKNILKILSLYLTAKASKTV